jgi:hypothetical protein
MSSSELRLLSHLLLSKTGSALSPLVAAALEPPLLRKSLPLPWRLL